MLDPIQICFRIIRLIVRVFDDRTSELTNCSPSGNLCDPDFLFAFLRAGITPLAPREPSLPNPFVFGHGIYDAAIILGRIPGGTEPMWSRSLRTRLTIEHGKQFARLLSTVEHRPTPAQLSERDHARATRASLLAGNSPGPREAHPRALKVFFLFRFFVCLVLVFKENKSKQYRVCRSPR